MEKLITILKGSELLKSKKVKLALVTGLAAGLAKYFDVDPEVMLALVGTGVAAILGQGMADLGKNAGRPTDAAATAQSLLGVNDDLLITLGVQALLAKLGPSTAARFRAVALKVYRHIRLTYAGDIDFN